jgi:hypothetical protein
VTEPGSQGGFIPGDVIELSFEFQHQMNLDQVAAVFINEQVQRSAPIILSGTPDTVYGQRAAEGNDFHSTVTLHAEIEADAPPGFYGCEEVFVLTKGGQHLGFEYTPQIGFWVLSEPDASPKFSGEVRPGPTS